jgi:16S rRNA (uracil1498-N3)-methyltransferase
MSLPRFHVPDAAAGRGRIVLPEHAAHHAHEVLRLRPGDAVRIFDGRGSEFEAVLEAVHRKEVSARLGEAVEPRPESPLRLTLAVAPLKGDRMELVIQKATELGVAEIRPVVTIRTDAAARPALRGSRQERWDKVASGAAEQCGRAVVPQVQPTVELDELLRMPFDGRKLLFLETEAVPALRREPKATSATLLIGPPGGFEDRETDAARAAGYEAARLGPRVLRTETAALAALAVVQLLWGDLG